MSKNSGPNSNNASKEGSREGLKISSAPKVKTSSALFQAYLKKAVELLFERALEPHRLTQLQALRERLTPVGRELTEEEAQEIQKQLQACAEEQALNLADYHALDTNFNIAQELIQGFLKIIRTKINDPILTPVNLKAALKDQKAQLENLGKARLQFKELSIKAELAKQELAVLKAKAYKEEPKVAPPPPPVEGSAPPKPPALSPVELADAQVKDLEKAVNEAKTQVKKVTVVDIQLEGAYSAFIHQTLNMLPREIKQKPSKDPIKVKGESSSLLEAIAYELQFGKQKVALTPEEIKALLTEKNDDTVLANKPAADAVWKPIQEGRKKRLEEVESNKGPFVSIAARIADWNEKIPKALSTEQMNERDAITPYQETEGKERRRERVRLITGLEEVRRQKDEKAVARDKALRKNEKTRAVAKHLHEADDVLRAEFEGLGIKVIPMGKRPGYGLLGAQAYRTQFESTDPTDPDPRRNILDVGAPAAFPERKAGYAKAITPALDRHLQIGANNGLLVGRRDKPDDKYWEAKAQQPLENASLNAFVAGLGRMKL